MNREDRQIDKEYPRRDREFMQQIVDMWIPGLKLPPSRTEEEFKLAVESPVSDITGEELMKQVKTNRVFYQEGYAQAERDLKREPLSIQEIYDLDRYSQQPFEIYTVRECISWIRKVEKAHGIGGEE